MGRRWNSGLFPPGGRAWGAGTRCSLVVPVNSLGERRAEPSTPTRPSGAPRLSRFKALLRVHPFPAPFPQPWITQLEIMLLPVTSKPTGASAKVNTSSSQFH